jgi:hypothetical protein
VAKVLARAGEFTRAGAVAQQNHLPARVTIRVSATQARMMSTECLRIVRAMKGELEIGQLPLLSEQQGTYQRTRSDERSNALAGRGRTCCAHQSQRPSSAAMDGVSRRHVAAVG